MGYRARWREIWGKKAPDAPLHGVFVGDTFVPPVVEFEADGDRGEPRVRARFEMREGVPETVDFRLSATETGRGVRTRDLLTWQPLETLALNAFRQVAKLVHRDSEGRSRGAVDPKSDADEWVVRADLENAQAKRRGVTDAELARVAQIYREAIDGSPTLRVEAEMDYPRRTAIRRIRQARDRGFLPQTTQGKKKAVDDDG